MNDKFVVPVCLRWADLDPNQHMRHSVYYDFGATCRILFFNSCGLDRHFLQSNALGPIVFREECLFKREVHFGDDLAINMVFTKARRDFSRWSIHHELIREDGTLCAEISLDGAWIDTGIRRLKIPSDVVISMLGDFPRTSDFSWV
jgi:acyl-CoA thioester hydrolase